MRTVLSLLLMTGAAFAQPAIKDPTRAEVEAAVARCDNPMMKLRASQCDVIRNRLKSMKGELPAGRALNETGREPKRPEVK